MNPSQYEQLLKDIGNTAVGYAEGRATIPDVLALVHQAKEIYEREYQMSLAARVAFD